MSKPILYNSTETTFDTNGIGILSDAINCIVTEERNGSFELEMQYPISGIHYDKISLRNIIFAKPSKIVNPQPFRIYRITRPINGIVTVFAEHISYDLSGIPVQPFVANSAGEAMLALVNNAAIYCPFTFWTDKSTVGKMTVSVPSSIRSLLGGNEGSILDVYGGEYEFDRYTVRLMGERGRDRGVQIRYGKNLTDLKQDENCAEVYTGVFPYWSDMDGSIVTIPEKIVSAPGTYNFTRIFPLNLSSDWQDAPSADKLRERAQKYITDNKIGVPKVSLTVDFVQLEQTEEYKGLALLERVQLCDMVSVVFPALGVDATAKCIKTVYDVLLDRYQSVSLGDARANLADTIVEQQKELEKVSNPTFLQQAINSLTASILGAKGGSVRLLDTNGDGEPDTLYIADNPDPAQAVKVWRFNYEGWGASSNGYNGPFVLGASLNDGIIADFITAGTLSANLMRAGVLQDKAGKVFNLNLDAGTLDANFTSLKVSGKTTEQIAIEKAKEAADAAEKAAKEAAEKDLKEYQATVDKSVQDLQNQIDGNITTWFYPHNPTNQNEPASNWTTDVEKENHAGDLFYNTDPASGKAYRWAIVGNSWQWLLLEDTDVAKALANANRAQDTADAKRRTFISTPVPPYDVGDLWTQGGNGELLVCTNAKATGAVFAESDWSSAADYTEQVSEAGRNLILNSAYIGMDSPYPQLDYSENQVKIKKTDAGNIGRIDSTLSLTNYGIQKLRNRKITVSYYYKITEAITYTDKEGAWPGLQGNVWITFADGTTQYIGAPNNDYKSLGTSVMDDFVRVNATVTVYDKEITDAKFKVFMQSATGEIIYKNPKVEIGETATAWTPAPEDAVRRIPSQMLANTTPTLTQEEIFNRLTNNGQMQGLYMQDGNLYINSSYIKSGTLNSDLLRTGTINGSSGTSSWSLDSGHIRSGSSSGTRVEINPGTINWYYNNYLTGVVHSAYGKSYIGSNSRFTFFGWFASGTPDFDRSTSGATSEFIGLYVQQETGLIHCNANKFEIPGRIECASLAVNGREI